jgi:hypothetical protein
MFSRMLNAAIVDLQKRASLKYGADTREVIQIVNNFTKEVKDTGVISAIDTIKAKYIAQWGL